MSTKKEFLFCLQAQENLPPITGDRRTISNKLEKRFDHTGRSANATAYFCDASDMKGSILALRPVIQVAGVCRDIAAAILLGEALAHDLFDEKGSDAVLLDGAWPFICIRYDMVNELALELGITELV
jgi:hypothetical protein